MSWRFSLDGFQKSSGVVALTTDDWEPTTA